MWAFIRVMVGLVKKKGLIDNSKKGQITIFIILGLVILFIAVFFLFYIREADKPIDQEPEEIPTEFLSIENFVEECLYDTSVYAFELLGGNGGYINPQKYFTKGFEPTESEVLEFSPGSNLWLPYWWYFESRNECREGCSFASNRPALYRDEASISVEEMIDDYVAVEILTCLNDFNALHNEFEIIPGGDVEIKTIIAEQDVIVDMYYPLEIEGGDSSGEISRFRSRLDLNFKEIYDLATDIRDAEAEGNFLDYNTLLLIDGFSTMGSSDKLPPVAGFKFEPGATPLFWIHSEVKSKMEEMLMSYVPFTQIYGNTNYFPIIPEDIEDERMFAIYDMMTLNIVNRTIPADLNLGVSFNYLAWWPIYLHITPSKGGMIGPESYLFPSIVGFINNIFGMQRYDFAYDVSYPVIVEIENKDAFLGEGYNFVFALESNLRNNEPINVSAEQLFIPSPGRGLSMACNLNQRNSDEIIVNVIDGATDEPVENAIVYFALGTEECMIGSTDVDGQLVSKFPIGFGALKVSKMDYADFFIPYGVKLETPDNVNVIIEPYRYINASIEKKTLSKASKYWPWRWEGLTKQVDENEEVILMLEKIIGEYEQEVTVPLHIKGNNKTELRIIPGDYRISAQVILNEEIDIPEDERCEGDWFFKECVDIDAVELEQSISGGLELTNETPEKYWHLTVGNLDNREEIIFKVLSFSLKDVPLELRIVEDLGVIGNVANFTKNNWYRLEPTYR